LMEGGWYELGLESGQTNNSEDHAQTPNPMRLRR
jgi:hypothetical protein